MMRWSALMGAGVLCLVLSCEGGCDSDYEYPRTDPAAAPTHKALRLRVTQSGLDAISRGLPGIIAAGCAQASGTATTCTVDDPINPSEVEFFLGTPASPISFTGLGSTGVLRAGGTYPLDREFEGDAPLSNTAIEARSYCDDTGGSACLQVRQRGLGTSGTGFCRDPDSDPSCNNPATDYCCGGANPNICSGTPLLTTCEAPRSRMGLDFGDLASNLHLDLMQDGDGGGIRVTIGCTSDDPGACLTDRATYGSKWVQGSFDMVLFADLATGGDVACYIQNDPGRSYAFELKRFRFTARPQVVSGGDGKPYLQVTESDITVEAFDVDLYIDIGAALNDPGCYDYGWWNNGLTVSGPMSWSADCTAACGSAGVVQEIAAWVIEQGPVARTLATVLVRTALEQVAGTALEAAGELDVTSFLPIDNRGANPVGYLLTTNTDSPEVTGATGELGLNFDVDSGFVSEHSVCVPGLTPRPWDLPLPPDPGATVTAIDPVTLQPVEELFDLALLVGDSVVSRALFELYDGGSFCYEVGAEAAEQLSGGAFVPTVGVVGIVAPGIGALAPADAPVDLGLSPNQPPVLSFGTGAGQGEARDSHVQLAWPGLEVDIYPLVDDTFLRAVALSLDLDLGLSLEPTPGGDLQIMIDRLDITNVVETYNEMTSAFDAEGFGELIEMFVPMLLSREPLDVGLTAAALGLPFVPKARAIGARGAGNRYLGVFLRFCTAAELADPANPLCYEPVPGGGNAPAGQLGVERVAGPGGGLAKDTVRVRAYSDVAATAQLQLAYRVDGVGPYFSFRGPEADGLFTLEHPLLRLPGEHVISVLGRPAGHPAARTEPAELRVLVDAGAPRLATYREAGGVRLVLWDDTTPAERIEVRAVVTGPAGGAREQHFASIDFVPAAAEESVTLWARDEAGNLSEPLFVAAVAPAATDHIGGEQAPDGAGGCAAAAAGMWAVVAMAAVLLVTGALRVRRRER